MTRTADSIETPAVLADPIPEAVGGMARELRRIGGAGLSLEEARARQWQSVTFAGTRMELRFTALTADEAARVAASLDAASVTLPGHIVADLCGWADGRSLNVEALTVTDD
jgi:hypothetical protein